MAERYAEEWLASLPTHSRYQRWCYAASLLLRGARSTRAALEQRGQSSGRRLSTATVIVGAVTALTALAWCVKLPLLHWSLSSYFAAYVEWTVPSPFDQAADLAERLGLLIGVGLVCLRGFLGRTALVFALPIALVVQWRLAPMLPSVLQMSTPLVVTNCDTPSYLINAFTEAFLVVGAIAIFDGSLGRGQRTVTAIQVGLMGALYHGGFGWWVFVCADRGRRWVNAWDALTARLHLAYSWQNDMPNGITTLCEAIVSATVFLVIVTAAAYALRTFGIALSIGRGLWRAGRVPAQ